MTNEHALNGGALGKSIVPGREVRSPKYGKGFIAQIEGDVIKVRFWKRGYVAFHKPEGDYPFELLDEVRAVTTRLMGSNAHEADAEKKKQARCCEHGDDRHFCLKCSGLTNSEIDKWNQYRTKGRRIYRTRDSVRISQADCVLVSRKKKATPKTKMSFWYRCLSCEKITDLGVRKDKLPLCPTCNGSVISIPEPFQAIQFSGEIRGGAKGGSYADAKPIRRAPRFQGADIARDLFVDPNSRLEVGGTGYLRIPLDEPRSTRRDAPEWLECRKSFLLTLRKTRAERAERIFYGFYFEQKTDDQIAASEDWTKDSIKKERKELLERGNQFFQALSAKHPPSPAIYEREDNPEAYLPRTNRSARKIPKEETLTSGLPRKDSSILSTNMVVVWSPEPNVLRVDSVFEKEGERFAKTTAGFIPLAKLEGFLREEPAAPRIRCSYHLGEAAD